MDVQPETNVRYVRESLLILNLIVLVSEHWTFRFENMDMRITLL